MIRQIQQPATLPKYDIQRFADDEPPTFEYNLSGEKIKLPEKVGDVSIKDVLSRVAAATRKETEAKLEARFKPLQEQITAKDADLETIKTKLQQIEDEKLTAEEKVKKEFERTFQKLEQEKITLAEKANKSFSKYREKAIMTEIHAALSGFELFDPDQTLTLMLQKGRPELVEKEDGSEQIVMRLTVDGEEKELSPKEYAKLFLALPQNMNQLRAGIKPGAGTSVHGATRNGSGQLVYARSAMQNETTRKEYMVKMKELGPENVRIDESR